MDSFNKQSDFKSFWTSEIRKQDKKQWITVHGAHIPIEDGQSKDDAIKHAFSHNKKTASDKPVRQNAKDLDELYDQAPAAKEHIDKIGKQLARHMNGGLIKAPLKPRPSAERKMKRDYGGDHNQVTDIARNTVLVNSVEDLKMAHEKMANHPDTAQSKLKTAETDPLGYSGSLHKIKTPSGHIAETQINLPEIIFAKEPEKFARGMLGNELYQHLANHYKQHGVEGGHGHKHYEDWRTLLPMSRKAQAIARQSKKYYSEINEHGKLLDREQIKKLLPK